jgi:hypothetical protein
VFSHKMVYISPEMIVRYWDISQIRTPADAEMVRAGDVIEYGDFRFTVTWTSPKEDGPPVWCGTIGGIIPWEAVRHTNLTVIAWGSNGVASSYPQYKEGKFLLPETPLSYYDYYSAVC